jgi:hypothetical protein
MKMRVYGHLNSDPVGSKVEIGIARGMKEFYEYKAEYCYVFGNDIHICYMPMSEEEYKAEHRKAIGRLMGSLVAPTIFYTK